MVVKGTKKTSKTTTKVKTIRSTKSSRLKAPSWFARIKWPKPLRVFGGYFKGAWDELRQVRWPNRRSTWSLTLAVILFSLFFAGVILALDYAFNYLFKEILL